MGLGGLGHLAIQFLAKAVGAEVFAISHSPNKREEAMKLGATHFVGLEDIKDNTLDVVLNTTPGSVTCLVAADLLACLFLLARLLNHMCINVCINLLPHLLINLLVLSLTYFIHSCTHALSHISASCGSATLTYIWSFIFQLPCSFFSSSSASS